MSPSLVRFSIDLAPILLGLPVIRYYGWKTKRGLVRIAQVGRINMAGGMTLPSSKDTIHQEGRCVVEEDIEKGSVDLQPVVVVNEAEFATVKTMPCRCRGGATGDARGREET